jgi:hypothetical protein
MEEAGAINHRHEIALGCYRNVVATATEMVAPTMTAKPLVAVQVAGMTTHEQDFLW